ncbi:MAG: zinc-ribbon domain containing protein [Deltaproteobacteria bacterium]|nr:zinc-ribbon domain containing protein [Deltaproteobacteria bacterium]
MYQDKTLTCRDCGQDFTFTAGEQEFYAAKGFENQPTRCKPCRGRKKVERGDPPAGARSQRELFAVVCDDCGQETQVPFRPSQDRPVYCRDCFSRRRN